MIKNDTALETLFEKRLDEILDIVQDDDCILDVDSLLIDFANAEVYRFMHYFNKSDNPSGICQFVLKKTYTDFTNDEFGEEKELEFHKVESYTDEEQRDAEAHGEYDDIRLTDLDKPKKKGRKQ